MIERQVRCPYCNQVKGEAHFAYGPGVLVECLSCADKRQQAAVK